ncbi:FKBP-type peptidyl-prolyl cis-trans isomerase [Patescibacteria group bacterium]|nr:FKBP-type peptidyl-prolyl cis-trans isomerase [Patescibacteria group bacterium]
MAIFSLYSCNKSSIIQTGDIVNVYYTIQDQSNNVIQTNSGSQVLEVIAGQSSSVPYIEKMVLSMKYGQTKTQTVAADDAYGKFYDPNKLQVVSKTVFDSIGLEPEVGEKYVLGDTIVIVREIGEDTITIDLNPAFTKEAAVYTVTVLEKNP